MHIYHSLPFDLLLFLEPNFCHPLITKIFQNIEVPVFVIFGGKIQIGLEVMQV